MKRMDGMGKTMGRIEMAMVGMEQSIGSMNRRRTAVVTGATSGIGLASLKALVAGGWACIAIGRSRIRMDAADRAVRTQTPDACVHWLEADLSAVSSIRVLSARIRARLENGFPEASMTDTICSDDEGPQMPALFPVRWDRAAMPGAPASGSVEAPLDALVLCAGLVTDWYLATEDGYETQFAVNHLSQFHLAEALRPNLHAAGEARIVTISSGSHYNTRIRWEDIMLRQHYNPLAAYKQSKLCNVLFAAEWNRRNGDIATAVAVDPGLVCTEIGLKGTTGIVRAVWKWRMKSGVPAERPAACVAELLECPRTQLHGRLYWKDCRPRMESRIARNPETAARLWRLSERLCGYEQ